MQALKLSLRSSVQAMKEYAPMSPAGLAALAKVAEMNGTLAARQTFRRFVSLVNPAYQWALHNLVLSQALQLVAERKIRRLIVMMPPRHGKTELTSVSLSGFEIGRNPASRVVLASYAQPLAILNSRRVRDMVRAAEYRRVFGVGLNEKKANEREWETTAGGGLMAVGVGSGLTGRGADLIIIDDPVKDAEEANSPTIRENTWQWFSSVARTRLMPAGAIVVVMTPWHEQDLAHRLVREAENGGEAWYVLRLPAIAEDDDPLGRPPGAALWPERYPVDDLMAIRQYDAALFAALYQCRPRSEGSKMFNIADFALVDAPSVDFPKWVRSWDIAITEKQTSDYTVGALLGCAPAGSEDDARRLAALKFKRPMRYCLADVVRERKEWPDIRQLILETAARDGKEIPVLLEESRLDLAAVQEIRRDLLAQGFRVEKRRAQGGGDKVARAAAVAPAVAAGLFEVLRREWRYTLLNEFDLFPQVDHDDQVDAVSQAVEYLTSGGLRIG